ncbi:PR-1-like protein [Testicularia cyperi]|uniref:PR-1-like protein n=1 Tax=Testicularia cyperi TaxID=1882483 RepID=A0A317Y0Y0_9BASI|nr:PR-1-like protein [Testicularia cyperi]
MKLPITSSLVLSALLFSAPLLSFAHAIDRDAGGVVEARDSSSLDSRSSDGERHRKHHSSKKDTASAHYRKVKAEVARRKTTSSTRKKRSTTSSKKTSTTTSSKKTSTTTSPKTTSTTTSSKKTSTTTSPKTTSTTTSSKSTSTATSPKTTSTTTSSKSSSTTTSSKSSSTTTSSKSSSTTTSSKSTSSTTSSTKKSTTSTSTSTKSSTTTTTTSSKMTTTTSAARGTTTTTTSASKTTTSSSSGSSPTPNAGFESDILRYHNDDRARHEVPALKWDTKLVAAAAKWAAGCKWQHTPNNQYGENLAAGTASDFGAGDATSMWYDEISEYDYENPGFSSATGHFTQMVWKSTERLGCALQVCPAGSIFSGSNSQARYIVCEYDPPGNYVGEFAENVLPPQV